jgi:mannosyltransferase
MRREFPAAPAAARPEPAAALPTAPPAGRAAWRTPAWLRDWMALTGPLVTLALMLSGLAARPFWGDEADTISAVRRSVPQLIHLLGHVDAVHGLYYLLLWPVVQLAGPGEFPARLPSALAVAAAAAGITAIARRLVSRQAGLYASLIFAVLPRSRCSAWPAWPAAAGSAGWPPPGWCCPRCCCSRCPTSSRSTTAGI